jgi:hypothetical protein
VGAACRVVVAASAGADVGDGVVGVPVAGTRTVGVSEGIVKTTVVVAASIVVVGPTVVVGASVVTVAAG